MDVPVLLPTLHALRIDTLGASTGVRPRPGRSSNPPGEARSEPVYDAGIKKPSKTAKQSEDPDPALDQLAKAWEAVTNINVAWLYVLAQKNLSRVYAYDKVKPLFDVADARTLDNEYNPKDLQEAFDKAVQKLKETTSYRWVEFLPAYVEEYARKNLLQMFWRRQADRKRTPWFPPKFSILRTYDMTRM